MFAAPSSPSLGPSASPTLPSDPTRSSPPPEPDTALSVTAALILTQLLSPASSSPSSLPALHPLLQLHVTPLPDSPASAAPPTYPPVSPSPSIPLCACVYPPTLKRLYLSCGLLPLYGLLAPDGKQGSGKVVWVGEKVVREGVKGPTVDIGFVKRAREASALLRPVVRSVLGAAGGAGEVVMRDEGEERATIGASDAALPFLQLTRLADDCGSPRRSNFAQGWRSGIRPCMTGSTSAGTSRSSGHSSSSSSRHAQVRSPFQLNEDLSWLTALPTQTSRSRSASCSSTTRSSTASSRTNSPHAHLRRRYLTCVLSHCLLLCTNRAN